MRQSGAGLSVRPGQKNFTPESSGVKSMINSTVPPCLRPRRAVARDRCNGRARPGPPGRLGSGTAGAVRRNLPPKRSPLCAPPSGFVSVHANFLSVTIAPARAACQGGIAGKAVLFAEAVSSAGGAGAVETTKNIRLKLCNQPNLFPLGQPSLDFPRR